MKQILLFGAGKSATVLINYLVEESEASGWVVTVVDQDPELARKKIGDSDRAKAVAFDIRDEAIRTIYTGAADLVISLLPPSLHILVARDCLRFGKNLLTASYADADIRELAADVESAGLLFLCEMGLDPGIDHMSAKKLIDEIQAKGGVIESFFSHCGGLVAPQSDDNPWHYKISWNPRNVVNAGKAGAIYRENGEIRELEYNELFSEKRFVSIPGHDVLCWYPNRDSLSYIPVYGLQNCQTFIRTTLRHPDFIYGWKNLIDLNLTDDRKAYDTAGKTLMDFFKDYMDRNGFNEWLEHRLSEQFDSTKNLLAELVNLVELEQKAAEKGIEQVEEFMVIDDNGDLKKIDIDDLKVNAATTLAEKMHDASLTLKQLFFLGLDDDKIVIPYKLATPAEVLQLALEKKLLLRPEDHDRVVMLHELIYRFEGQYFKTTSTLVADGETEGRTAMSKTVGLPLGIAAKLILNGTIKETGIRIPVTSSIYNPVLAELEAFGINFEERTVKV